MTAEDKAKELYNESYEIVQNIDKYSYLTRDEEKSFSKEISIKVVDEMIGMIDKLHKPEYTTFINEYETELSPADIVDGYELKDFLEEVKLKIQS